MLAEASILDAQPLKGRLSTGLAASLKQCPNTRRTLFFGA